MDQTILFSPVGGTDPISWNNGRDGSMLHICRCYKPDKVILYMSKEMLDFQEQDDRYRYCLKQLEILQNREMQIEECERPDLVNVQDFDFFYNDFRTLLLNITKEMDVSDRLLLNVSSGTPAMKSCLQVLANLGEIRCTAIQVSTPVRKINDHNRDGYDVKLAWDVDEDNQKNFENRCKEIQSPGLIRLKQEEIIKKLVMEYDYQAAAVVADAIVDGSAGRYRSLLDMAINRMLLNLPAANKTDREEKSNCIPIKRDKEEVLFEYALALDIRLRKGEYADFIRAISPLIAALFENILKNRCHVDVETYIRTDKTGIRRWDSYRLTGSEIYSVLNEGYPTGFQYGFVKSDHFVKLIDHFGANDQKMVGLVDSIRNIEEDVRNKAAHEMVSITDDNIIRYTGCSAEDIMEKLKNLFKYSSIDVEPEYWDSYDQMNEVILHRITSL
ncbi:MAG: type III-A CRISPR-associated CARF protein Csm6 [Bilifractor sp.]